MLIKSDKDNHKERDLMYFNNALDLFSKICTLFTPAGKIEDFNYF